MVDYVELEKEKDKADKNKYKVLVGKEYINIHLTVFRITMFIVFLIGFGLGAWLL